MSKLKSAVWQLIRKYPNLFGGLLVDRFIKHRMDSIDYNGKIFKEDLEEQFESFLTEEEKSDKVYMKELTRDIILCYLLYRITPDEYFMHDFRHEDEKYKSSIIGFAQKDYLCIKSCGDHFEEYYNQLKNKWIFYQLTKPYFKRQVCRIHDAIDFDEFEKFAKNNNRFIIKPNSSCSGQGVHIVDLKKDYNDDIRGVFNHYLKSDNDWIVEELIVQDEEMAQWHRSSVNTVRLPSIMTENGPKVILPLFRTGKGGNIVDNCHNDGGLMAVPDEKTGILITDGYDIYTHVVECHPDTGLKFKGWQIPKWNELLQVASEIHTKCLPHHKYIGFDFALTPKGWVVIEGNWGNLPHQVCVHRGIRQEFEELMNS